MAILRHWVTARCELLNLGQVVCSCFESEESISVSEFVYVNAVCSPNQSFVFLRKAGSLQEFVTLQS